MTTASAQHEIMTHISETPDIVTKACSEQRPPSQPARAPRPSFENSPRNLNTFSPKYTISDGWKRQLILHQQRYKRALEAENQERDQRVRVIQEKWKQPVTEQTTTSAPTVVDTTTPTVNETSQKLTKSHRATLNHSIEKEKTLEEQLESLRLDDSQQTTDGHSYRDNSPQQLSANNNNNSHYNSEEHKNEKYINNKEQRQPERGKGRGGRQGESRGRRNRRRGRGRGRGQERSKER
jgi:hypothetical protein